MAEEISTEQINVESPQEETSIDVTSSEDMPQAEQSEQEASGSGDPEKAKRLYNNLISSKKFTQSQLGSESEFLSAISDRNKASKIYDGLSNAGFTKDQIGDKNEFLNVFSAQQLPQQPKKSWYETSALSPTSAIKPKPEEKALAPVTAPPVKEKQKPQQPSDDTFKKIVENPIVGAGLSMLGGIGAATKVAGALEGTGAVDYGKYVWNKLVETAPKIPSGLINGIVRLSAAATDLAFKNAPQDVRDAVLHPIIQDTDKWTKEYLKEPAKKAELNLDEKRKKDFDHNFVASAVASIPSLALQSTVPLGLGFAGDAFDTAIDNINNNPAGKNLPESVKTIYGTANAATIAVLSEIGLDKIVGGKLMPKLSSKLTAETITNLLGKSSEPITKEAFEIALKENANRLKNKIVTNASKLGHSAAVGSAFMGANEALNIMSEKLVNKISKQDVFEPTGWGEGFMRVVKAGAEGAGFGLVMGGTHIPFAKADNYIKDRVAESKGANDINAIKNEIAENVKSGKINEQQSNIMNSLVDQYANIHSSIPSDVPNKSQVIGKIKQSNDIRQQAQDIALESANLHPAFQEQRMKEAEALNKSADDIDNSIAGKPKYKIGEQDVDRDTFVNFITSPEADTKDVELTVENDNQTSDLLNKLGKEKNWSIDNIQEEDLPNTTIVNKKPEYDTEKQEEREIKTIGYRDIKDLTRFVDNHFQTIVANLKLANKLKVEC